MPIARTYPCPECFTRIDVILSAEEWDAPAPSCEACDARLNQEFHPPAIGGSNRMKAARIAEDIIANDYGVANFQSDRRRGGVPKIRYKDDTGNVKPSDWQVAGQRAILEQAISIGKQNRRDFGMDGLDMLKRGLASGAQVDLIEASKRKAIKVW